MSDEEAIRLTPEQRAQTLDYPMPPLITVTSELSDDELRPGAVTVVRDNPLTQMVDMIERAVMNPTIDVEKMSRLMDLQERILDREAKQQFARAMHLAQSEIQGVVRAKANDQTRSKYADYEALDAMVRPVATRNGFSMTFGTEPTPPPDAVTVICDVMHIGGHEKRYRIDVPADGKGAKGGDVMTKTHATGSALTYGRRYLLNAIWNLVTTDDDGNRASSRVQYISIEMEKELDTLLSDPLVDRAAFMAFIETKGARTLADIKVTDFGLMKQRVNRAIAAGTAAAKGGFAGVDK